MLWQNVLFGLLTLFEGVIDVQQGQVVPVNVGESHLGLVGCFLGLVGTHEALWHFGTFELVWFRLSASSRQFFT